MNLKKLPEPDKLIDISLRRARKESGTVGKQANRVKWEKAREIRRVEVAANYSIKVLETVVIDFPNLSKMNQFYAALIANTIDTDKIKKSLGQFSAVTKVIKRLKGQHLISIKKLGRGKHGESVKISKQFIGRFSSVIKSLKQNIGEYNKAAEKLRELPHIKTQLETIIIAGHPNVGKSTLLGKITDSKPKVASYPFTTQKLEMGYFKQGYLDYQVIDTPGLLDREEDKRNGIERKGTAALKHLASIILFVIDPTESCGFSLEKQEKLLEGIAEEFGKEKLIVYLSKEDIASKEQVIGGERISKRFGMLKGKPDEMREELGKILKSKSPLN